MRANAGSGQVAAQRGSFIWIEEEDQFLLVVIEERKVGKDIATEQRRNASQSDALRPCHWRQNPQRQIVRVRAKGDGGCSLHRPDRATDAGAWRTGWEQSNVDTQESSVAWGKQGAIGPGVTKQGRVS